MYGAVLAFHLLVSVALVAVVLVQSSKGGGLAGGAFGGATQTVFGGRGATDFITRATITLGVIFFMTSLALALMTAKGGPSGGRSLMQEQARKAQTGAPQQPGRAPAPGGATQAPGGATQAPAGGATAPATGGR